MSDSLKANIQGRIEWEAAAWGPVLAVWAVLLVVRTSVEIGTGPRIDLGTAAWALTLGTQAFVFFRPGSQNGARRWPLHGLWVLVALTCWFLGTWAPSSGTLSPRAGAVLEMFLAAGALAQTGILKARRPLWYWGLGLLVCSVALGLVPGFEVVRPLVYAVVFGVPAALTLVGERRRRV